MVKKALAFIFLISLFLYLPSFFNFYTNDDFFHLSISKPSSFLNFINFFNPVIAPGGFGFYRPLTTQVYYSLSYYFGLNPLILHLISFAGYVLVIFLVFKFVKKLTENTNTALLAAFFYAFSASHFGHLYYLATFQELGFSLLYLLSILSLFNFLNDNKIKYYFFMMITFVGALLSKESAVTLPAVFFLLFSFYSNFKLKRINLKQFFPVLFFSIFILSIYLYLHIFYYGFATGDSYIWVISLRVINTISWYILWSLSIPEMLVDYIGPGFHINPNLLKFYSGKIILILILFGTMILEFLIVFIKTLKRNTGKDLKLYFFAVFWFLITLSPVVFLPLHKFSYELTLPLVAVSVILGNIISKIQRMRFLVVIILSNYLLLSFATNVLTYQTSWIVRGAQVAEKVSNFTDVLNTQSNDHQTIIFYDKPEDLKLLWLPSNQLKQILSDNNFFKAFYGDKIEARYKGSDESLMVPDAIMIRAKTFF